MQTQPTETLGQIVSKLIVERQLKRPDIIAGARIGVLSLLQIRENRMPSFDSMSLRRKKKWLQTIVRMACFFEQDPTKWLELVNIPLKEGWVKEVITSHGRMGYGASEAREMNSQMASRPLTVVDLEFLITVQKLLQQSLTFGLAYELVRRRNPKQELEALHD